MQCVPLARCASEEHPVFHGASLARRASERLVRRDRDWLADRSGMKTSALTGGGRNLRLTQLFISENHF